jgi:hypothetical protein
VVASGLAWVVVLVVGFGLGRLESGVAAVVTWVVAVIVALLGLRWARSTARARPEERPPAAILRPVVPESVTHSAVNVGMAGDVDLVREILGDRISGRQKLVTAAPRPTAPTAAPGSIPAPPVTGEVLSGVPLDSRSETGSRAGNGNGVVEADQGSLEGPGESGPGGRQPDDLTTIRGIGPRLAARLADAGVVTFRQLADMGAEDIARLQAELGTFVHRMEKDRWKEQAQQAHARKYGG